MTLRKLLCPSFPLIALFFSACMTPNNSHTLAGPITSAPGSIITAPDAPPPQPASSPDGELIGTGMLDNEEQAFIAFINSYRAENGLPPLQVSVALIKSSDWMSADMAAKNYLSHYDSLGRDPLARMVSFNYPNADYSGENIAAGYADAQNTFTQWKTSPSHNANMLNHNYQAIGVRRAYNPASEYGWYWTTDFGSTVDETVLLAIPLDLSRG
jgi:uncharacterized protein YkwD